MNKKLLALSCVLSVGASGLVACGGTTTMDAGTDTGTGTVDTGGTPVDAPATGCTGTDGLPCLTINRGNPPDMACTPTAPTGAARDVSFRLVKRGLTTTPIAGPFEVWTTNVLGTDCAGSADCLELTAGADGMVNGSIPADWYAYRVPVNAGAMTFATVGYNRPSETASANDVTAIDASIFATAIGLIRMGISRDMADGIVIGDMADCDGEGLNGTTVRFFRNNGTEEMLGTAATDMGLAYRAGGALPNPMLRSTDDSGGYAAANVPLGDGLINVVTYGTLTAGGAREPIGCEVVSLGAGVVTILSLGPLRSDYEAGSYCATLVTP